jgi:hypothetical protein
MNIKAIVQGSCALLLLTATAALAHEEFRVMGTISGKAGSVVTVKTRDGSVARITLEKTTAITRDKAPIAAAALKTGSYVVVDGIGDDLSELTAVQVRVVPPPKR